MAFPFSNSDFPGEEDDAFSDAAKGDFDFDREVPSSPFGAPGSFAFGPSSFDSDNSFSSSGSDFGDYGSPSGGGFLSFGEERMTDSDGIYGNGFSGGDSEDDDAFNFGDFGSSYMSRPNKNDVRFKQPESARDQILLIAESQTFMVNAITKSLENEFYDVIFSRPVPKVIAALPNRPNFIIIYVDNATRHTIETLSYLRELYQENESDISIYLVGNGREIEDAYAYLPREYTKGNFSRPLNVKLLVEKLRMNQALSEDDTMRKSILVVDDDPVMLRTIKEWLAGTYHVYMANSGANAIALLARNHVDLVLLDYEMPVISGAKVFEMMRSEPQTKDIPVMFLTARDDREAVLKVSALRPERYILKGTAPDEVIRIIDDFFQNQERHDS